MEYPLCMDCQDIQFLQCFRVNALLDIPKGIHEITAPVACLVVFDRVGATEHKQSLACS